MKYFVLLLVGCLFVAINSRAQDSALCPSNSPSVQNSDSLQKVTGLFLWYDNHSTPKKWVLEEKDIDEVYKAHPEWVKKYFPQILAKHDDLAFYIQVNLSCYLYLEGEKSHLEGLVNSGSLSEEENRVLNFYLNSFGIEL